MRIVFVDDNVTNLKLYTVLARQLEGPVEVETFNVSAAALSRYPHGLRGEDIPLCARVGDVFDALMSNRPDKRAWHFDPVVPQCFSRSSKELEEILHRFSDTVAA